jgi:hypothetical protein
LRKEGRLADIGKKLRTPRGMMYKGFFLFAQTRLKDWHLASVMSMRPDITNALGSEIEEGMNAPLAEKRLRQLAAATMRVVEIYYKPLLQMIWTLTTRMTGHTKKMPRMCGDLMRTCRELWPTLTDMILPTDFLDDEAVEVRNGIAHPAKTRFDVATQELVFEHDDGTEGRFTDRTATPAARASLPVQPHGLRIPMGRWSVAERRARIEGGQGTRGAGIHPSCSRHTTRAVEVVGRSCRRDYSCGSPPKNSTTCA